MTGTRLYEPYDEAAQPARVIDGYPNTARRTPSRPACRFAPTLAEATGPAFAPTLLAPGENDLSTLGPGRPRALGPLIEIRGRVCDEDGRPVAGALIELWQANAAGRYIHNHDDSDAPLDPNFVGVGRTVTDSDGRYAFRTVKPGPYPVPNSGQWWRPPHLHFSLFGEAFASRCVTQMYFPGEPLNPLDRLLNAIPDPAARARLVAQPLHPTATPPTLLGFAFDVVLRGRMATPLGDG